MRATLRDPRLVHRVPYLLETPSYHPYNRPSRSKTAKTISKLEEVRHANEREALNDMVAMTDDEWSEGRDAWWEGHCRRRRLLEARIERVASRSQKDEYGSRSALDMERWRRAKMRRRERASRCKAKMSSMGGRRKGHGGSGGGVGKKEMPPQQVPFLPARGLRSSDRKRGCC
jgi:hypothetical protein